MSSRKLAPRGETSTMKADAVAAKLAALGHEVTQVTRIRADHIRNLAWCFVNYLITTSIWGLYSIV